MTKTSNLLDESFARRAEAFFAAGGNPNGYFHRSESLYRVIRETEEVSDGFKEELIRLLDRDLIKGSDLVEAFQLGIFIGMRFACDPSDELKAVIKGINNLDNLPYVNIRGESVQ